MFAEVKNLHRKSRRRRCRSHHLQRSTTTFTSRKRISQDGDGDGEKNNNEKCLSVFDFSDENEFENHLQLKQQQQQLYHQQEQEQEQRHVQEEEESEKRGVVENGGDDDDDDDINADNIIINTDNQRNDERSSCAISIQKIKSSIDYHQRQLNYYQKKLDQLLTSLGINDDKSSNSSVIGNRNHGHCRKHSKEENDSGNLSPTDDNATSKSMGMNGSKNPCREEKIIDSAESDNNERRINDPDMNSNISKSIQNCDDRKTKGREKRKYHGEENMNNEKSINVPSVSTSPSSPPRKPPPPSPPGPSLMLSSSEEFTKQPSQNQQTLAFDVQEMKQLKFESSTEQLKFTTKPISRRQKTLAFDVQEIKQFEPFQNQRIVYNCFGKRGLEIQMPLSRKQPEPESMSNVITPQQSSSSAESACTYTNENMPMEQKQTTDNITHLGLKRKASKPKKIISQEHNGVDHETNIMTLDNLRASPFTTIIKTYYANKKKKLNDSIDVARYSQLDSESEKSKSTNDGDKRCTSMLESPPPPSSSSSSYYTCVDNRRTVSIGESCSNNTDRQECYQLSPSRAASSFVPISSDQKSIDATKRLWEKQVLYLRQQQQRQLQEEIALNNYSKSVDDNEDVFEDCYSTISDQNSESSPGKHKQKRKRTSGVVVDDKGDDDVTTAVTGTSFSEKDNYDVAQKSVPRTILSNTSIIDSKEDSPIHSPTTNIVKTKAKHTNRYIYILSSDSDESSDDEIY